MNYRSPAKINLFLRVLHKRPDQYHEVATLIQAIDLFDYLSFDFSEKDTFTCSDSKIPLDEKNLVIKALNLFRKKTGNFQPCSIHLQKNIPAEAGLGGGSGNAATTLFALNQLMKMGISDEELTRWSSEIGSDIPFFFSLGLGYCRGRGEIVKRIEPLSPRNYTICKPQVGLSTPMVFKALDLNSTSKKEPDELLNQFISGTPDYINDLEIPALKVCKELEEFKKELYKTTSHSFVMTGSGSAFYHPRTLQLPHSWLSKPVFRSPGNWY